MDTERKEAEREHIDETSNNSLDASQHSHRDGNVVDWDGPDDPEMPLNWSLTKKYTNTTILSVIALAV